MSDAPYASSASAERDRPGRPSRSRRRRRAGDERQRPWRQARRRAAMTRDPPYRGAHHTPRRPCRRDGLEPRRMTPTIAEVALVLFVGMGPVKVLVYYLTAIHDATPSVARRVARSGRSRPPRSPPSGLLVAGALLMRLLHFSGRGARRGGRHRAARLWDPDGAAPRTARVPAEAAAVGGGAHARGDLPDGRPAHPEPRRHRRGHDLLGRGGGFRLPRRSSP